MKTRVDNESHARAAPPPHTELLPRRCACGGNPGFQGECAECRSKRLRGASQRATTGSGMGMRAVASGTALHDFSRVSVRSTPFETGSHGARSLAARRPGAGLARRWSTRPGEITQVGDPPRRCASCELEDEPPHRLASDSDEDMLDFPRQTPAESTTTPAPAPPVSPPSPPPPAADCCTQALNAGLDRGDYGGIICCNNAKSVCVWQSNINRVVTNTTAQPIVGGCVRVHEATHREQVDCTGAAVERPPFRAGVDPNASECAAYRVEVPCYENNIDRCGTDAECRAQVQRELDFARRQVRRFCGSP